MPYDPNIPPPRAAATSQMFRDQFNSLKALIDAAPAGPPGPEGPAGPPGAQGPPGPGLTMQGDWYEYASYQPGDVVSYNGQIYVAMIGTSGAAPDGSGNWRLMTISGPPGEVTLAQLDARLAQLEATIYGQTARNVDQVEPVTGSFGPDLEAVANKVNELITGLKRNV